MFCTEPFRVPLAGKVTHCLFDKTGTLTTDQLVPVGVINAASPVFRDRSASSEQATISESNAIQIPMLSPVSDAAGVTAIILAACHSLVVVEDDSAASGSAQNSNLVGDPIEVAAIKGVEWSWDAKSSTATPGGSISTQTSALNLLKNKLKEVNEVPTPQHSQHQQQHKAVVDSITSQIVECEKRISESKIKMSKAFCSSVRVLQRHHFSSSLQRMSVVCKCITTSTSSSGSKSSTTENYCLVKGSPEAIYGLLENDGDMCPTWYKVCLLPFIYVFVFHFLSTLATYRLRMRQWRGRGCEYSLWPTNRPRRAIMQLTGPDPGWSRTWSLQVGLRLRYH